MSLSGSHSTYLDCAATTPLEPRVREVLLRHFEETGNAGSRTHGFGKQARRVVEAARQQVAAVAAAARSEVIFTSGATESNNLAILGLAAYGRDRGKRHIVTTAIEHAAVLGPMERMEQLGFAVTRVCPEGTGRVACEAVLAAVRPETMLVSVMHVNNETGVIQPVEEIADGLAGHEAFFHMDAAQGFGKDIARLRHPRIDLISASAHKIHGPQGVGALIARRRKRERIPLSAVMHGGGQEMGLRPGTLPVALIAAFGLAAELAFEEWEQRAEHCRKFRERLLEALAPLKPVLNGDVAQAVPNMINLSFPGRDAEAVMEAWDGIAAVSNGAACSSQSYACSHVLSAMGLEEERKAGALRLSWSHLTPEPDYVRMVEAVRAMEWIPAR
ncbi:MAG: aminotransferase class V-fold PLP-dependent enzyme [Bryobacterales bacterium]|nr:aminotransferase class V-fold PLP-dependent enzyme [Bryobacterales bacterium]